MTRDNTKQDEKSLTVGLQLVDGYGGWRTGGCTVDTQDFGYITGRGKSHIGAVDTWRGERDGRGGFDSNGRGEHEAGLLDGRDEPGERVGVGGVVTETEETKFIE